MLTLKWHATSITLPSPLFNDKLSINYRKIINKNRGNELIVSKKIGYDYLNSVKTVSYEFEYLDSILRNQLLDFLGVSVGSPIDVTDYDNLVYRGIVITPSADFTQPGRNNNRINLEIEVLKELVGNTIPISGLKGNKLITQGFGLKSS